MTLAFPAPRTLTYLMGDTPKERWQELAELASKETDPKKLNELVHQMIRLFDQNDKRINAHKQAAS